MAAAESTMRTPPAPLRALRRSSGVTLVELIVGLSLMTAVVGGAFLALNAGMSSQEFAYQRMETLQRARAALALIAADLRSACVWDSMQFELIGVDRKLGEIEADNIDFATHNYRPARPGEADFAEVSYFVDRNPLSGELGIWRRRDPTPDELPMEGGQKEEIIRGVRQLRFEYTDGYVWYDSWGSTRMEDREQRPRPGQNRGNEPGSENEGSPGEEDPTDPSLLMAGNLYGLPKAIRITIKISEVEEEERSRTTTLGVDDATASSIAGSDSGVTFQTIVNLELEGREFATANSSGASNSMDGGNDSSEDGQ